MPIKRDLAPAKARFTVGLNIVPKSWRTFARVTGSKQMSEPEQDRLMTVEQVRVLIVDATDDTNVLLDETAEAKLFSTGSVGYGLNTRSATFNRAT